MRVCHLGALALLMLCAPLHFVSAQPRLSLVGGTTPDFGVIYTPSIERLITLRNVGTDTLTISGVSTSCGCTAALVSNDHIAPGDSGILSVKFDAKSYSGKVEKLVSLNTNDTTQKHVNIKFAATVIKSLDFEPEYFFFSTTIDSLTEKTIAITNSSSQTIHILSVKPSSELVSLKLSEDKLEPGEESSLSCTIRPTEPGTVRGNIEILTDFREHPKLSISYFAYTKAKKIKLN